MVKNLEKFVDSLYCFVNVSGILCAHDLDIFVIRLTGNVYQTVMYCAVGCSTACDHIPLAHSHY